MRRITAEVTDLVLEFGGALSGEHGDGLARSEWNRKMFGPAVYEAFSPGQARLRPGQSAQPRQGRRCTADDREPALRSRLCTPPNRRRSSTTASRRASSARSSCATAPASAASCRAARCARRSGRRCDEKDSTRGRANALRLALAGEQPLQAISVQPLGLRRARSVPDVQGVQGGVPQQRGHGQAEGGVLAVLL